MPYTAITATLTPETLKTKDLGLCAVAIGFCLSRSIAPNPCPATQAHLHFTARRRRLGYGLDPWSASPPRATPPFSSASRLSTCHRPKSLEAGASGVPVSYACAPYRRPAPLRESIDKRLGQRCILLSVAPAKPPGNARRPRKNRYTGAWCAVLNLKSYPSNKRFGRAWQGTCGALWSSPAYPLCLAHSFFSAGDMPALFPFHLGTGAPPASRVLTTLVPSLVPPFPCRSLQPPPQTSLFPCR